LIYRNIPFNPGKNFRLVVATSWNWRFVTQHDVAGFGEPGRGPFDRIKDLGTALNQTFAVGHPTELQIGAAGQFALID